MTFIILQILTWTKQSIFAKEKEVDNLFLLDNVKRLGLFVRKCLSFIKLGRTI